MSHHLVERPNNTTHKQLKKCESSVAYSKVCPTISTGSMPSQHTRSSDYHTGLMQTEL